MFSMVCLYQTPYTILKVWYSMYRPLYIEAYTIPNYTRPNSLYQTDYTKPCGYTLNCVSLSMASKEYKQQLKLENPEKYQLIYGSGAKKVYRNRLKQTNPEKYKQVLGGEKAKYRKKNHVKITNERLLSKYGITYDRFNKMLTDQDNKCKACKEEFTSTKATHVDHCHNSGKIRGILCFSCNLALGYSKENISRLEGLISYLKEHDSF